MGFPLRWHVDPVQLRYTQLLVAEILGVVLCLGCLVLLFLGSLGKDQPRHGGRGRYGEADERLARARDRSDRSCFDCIFAERDGKTTHADGLSLAALPDHRSCAGITAQSLVVPFPDRPESLRQKCCGTAGPIPEIDRMRLASHGGTSFHIRLVMVRTLSIAEPHYRLFAQEPGLSRFLLSEIMLQTPGFHLARFLSIRQRLIHAIKGLLNDAQRRGELQAHESADMIPRYERIVTIFAGSCWRPMRLARGRWQSWRNALA